MRISFNIEYKTQWGHSLYVLGSAPELGGDKKEDAVLMSCGANALWSLSIELKSDIRNLKYKYMVMDSDGNVIDIEWGKPHQLLPCRDRVTLINVFDAWQCIPSDKPFYSSAFTQGFFARNCRPQFTEAHGNEMVVKIMAPMIASDHVVAISGEIPSLGAWNVRKALVLDSTNFPEWVASFSLEGVEGGFDYKFLILNGKTREVVAWESCDNRHCDLRASRNEVLQVSGLHLCNPLPLWKGAGTAIPVFSLRSDDDCGVGDFHDLMKMVDWAKATHQRILQILPINDTTMSHSWMDSYPYNANSTFALHPMYVRPSAIGTLSDAHLLASLQARAVELNKLRAIDYVRVNELKNEWLRALYSEFGENTKKSIAFRSFVKANLYWLKPYAAYCVLRDQFQTADFSQWREYSRYNEARLEPFVHEHLGEMEYVYFVQYHLDKQLREARNYARKNGVVLKGDIPIGISRTSVDAWTSPKLFNMNSQAGAPPDDFSVKGQNWGFPTYNWEEMAKDGFAWWKNRFKKMAEYFDAYRIDHILGFFRIWSIPMNAHHGLLGTFYPAMPFSEEELRKNYDFDFNRAAHTRPYITDAIVNDIFGDNADEVRTQFLTQTFSGCYDLKDFVKNQHLISVFFANKEQNEKNEAIANGLMDLVDEVLFVEDESNSALVHPRISATQSRVFHILNDYQKWCFTRLYNDFYYHRHNDFWQRKALEKLPPLLDATQMLVCGEDLGMIPHCVPTVMQGQHILSLEIQRMPKDPAQDFGNPYWYPYECVCTTSSHDMSGVRGWWEENAAMTQRFYNDMMNEWGDAPASAEPWICERIIDMHLDSPAMLTILPLQDWLSIDDTLRHPNPKDEQINFPAVSRHYWRYRMHLTLEDLQANSDFAERIRKKVDAAGRF
ncbi:MAG: 4-alpha-glucanotransferase [Muribaculaceae bacterium]|nr:4-alpha-glucanotransferase [Muribaculaceae bacterium]